MSVIVNSICKFPTEVTTWKKTTIAGKLVYLFTCEYGLNVHKVQFLQSLLKVPISPRQKLGRTAIFCWKLTEYRAPN